MEHSECRVNRQVTINVPHDRNYHGKTGSIEKVNPVNMKVRMDDTGRFLNVHPMYLTTEAVDTAPVVTTYQYVPPLPMGTIVRCSIPKVQGIYVVCGSSRSRGGNDTKVAQLGGDHDRYWNVPAASLETLTLVELAHEMRTLVSV